MLCVQSTLEPAELQQQDLDLNVVFGFMSSSNSAFLRPPLLQTQPLWSPQPLIAQPFLAVVAAVQADCHPNGNVLLG